MTTNIEQNVLWAQSIAENFIQEVVEDGQNPLAAMMIASFATAHIANILWAMGKDIPSKKLVSEALRMSIGTIIDTAKMNGVETDLISPRDLNKDAMTVFTHNGEIVRVN